MAIAANVKCATFEGSGYPCEIDGFPSNAMDHKLRIENKCHISQESEVGNELYVKLDEERKDGMEMQYMESGFSGSGVFVDSMVKNTSLALFIKLRQRGTYSLVGNCRKLMRSLKVKDGQRYL